MIGTLEDHLRRQRPGQVRQRRGQLGRVEGLYGDPQPVTLLDRGTGREDLDVHGYDHPDASGFSVAFVNGWNAWNSSPAHV